MASLGDDIDDGSNAERVDACPPDPVTEIPLRIYVRRSEKVRTNERKSAQALKKVTKRIALMHCRDTQ